MRRSASPASGRTTKRRSPSRITVTTAPFTIGIVQDHAGADPAENLARATRLVRDAAGRGAQIICLKELFNSLYFCKSQQCDRFDLAEPVLKHRMALTFSARAEGRTIPDVIRQLKTRIG